MLEQIGAGEIRRIGVVDDDELGREELMDDLRDRHFEPVTVTGRYGMDVDRLVSDLMSQHPQFVICDHRLQPGGLASFFGLEVVRQLLHRKKPAMLVTMYQSTDRTRMELRSARHSVPLIMGRGDFQVDGLPDYIDIVRREVTGNPVDQRRAHRVLLQVKSVESSGDIEVVVPSWHPDQALTVPGNCIDSVIRGRVKVGDHILGDVNIGASSEEDLFFRDLNEIVIPKQIEGVP